MGEVVVGGLLGGRDVEAVDAGGRESEQDGRMRGDHELRTLRDHLLEQRDERELVDHLFARLASEYRGGLPGRELLLESTLKSLLALFSRRFEAHGEGEIAAPDRSARHFADFTGLVEQHYGSHWSIEAGAESARARPPATTSAHARELIDIADRNERTLMVGHTFEYNPAVRALASAIADGELGGIHYVDAVRVGLGLFHPTLNVIWDLAPHDVSILIHILGEVPESVSTRGLACVQSEVEDVAYVTLNFPSGIMAHIRLSWLDPSKTRRITVVGDKKMIVYDDVEAHEKLKVFDKRVDTIRRTDTFGDFQFAYHYGSIVSPYVHFEEPLRLECLHFAESILNDTRPMTDGWNGLRVVEVIEAAQRSLTAGGARTPVDMTLSSAAPTPASLARAAGPGLT